MEGRTIGRRTRYAFASLLLAASAGVPLAPARAAGHAADYVVVAIDEEGVAQPVFRRRVVLATPPRGLDRAHFVALRDRARRGEGRLAVRLRAADGRVVFRGGAVADPFLRGEFAGDAVAGGGQRIVGHRFPDPNLVFILRVPPLAGGELEIEGERVSHLTAEDFGPGPPAPLGGAASEEGGGGASPAGDPANRVDVLITGDGYTAAEQADFLADAAQLESEFLALTPQAEYANFVNMTTLFVASAESGADHPPYDPNCPGSDNPSCCEDPAAQTDPLAGTYVNTAFGARYCSFDIHRLLVVNKNAVFAAASAVPDWDAILVLVNDSTYGGSGGSVSVASTHPASVDVVRHEFGHSFTDLADEYDTPYPQYPSCSDLGGYSPCEANATDETSPSQVKWAHWIDPATPIPTPEGGGYGGDVGLFEGARYEASDMYRPFDSACLMHYLNEPFDPVCREAYVLRLYRGGWGEPADGIDNIEPGSEDPPPGSVDTDLGPKTYSVDLLEPVGGPPLAVEWRVDGVPVATGGDTYDFDPPGPGDYALEVRVEDVTVLVQPDAAGTDLQSSRSWSVHAVPEPSSPLLLASGAALLFGLARGRIRP